MLFEIPKEETVVHALHSLCRRVYKTHYDAVTGINNHAYSLGLEVIASAHEDNIRIAVGSNVGIEDIIHLAEKISEDTS